MSLILVVGKKDEQEERHQIEDVPSRHVGTRASVTNPKEVRPKITQLGALELRQLANAAQPCLVNMSSRFAPQTISSDFKATTRRNLFMFRS